MPAKIYYKIALDHIVLNDYLFESVNDAVETADLLAHDGNVQVYGFRDYPNDDPTPADQRVVFWKVNMSDARVAA